MSAPTRRGQRGGSTFRGARGSTPTAQPTRGSTRGSSAMSNREMGRGSGASIAGGSSAKGDGLLQKLRSGTVQRGSDSGAPGGRGWFNTGGQSKKSLTLGSGRGATRASTSSTSSTPGGRGHNSNISTTAARPNSAPQSRSASPAPASSFRDSKDDVNARFQFVSPPYLPVG
jgi:hypothetical protein